MTEITRRIRIGNILIFSIDERVCSKLENKFGMITGRNVKGMSFSRWMTTVPIKFYIWSTMSIPQRGIQCRGPLLFFLIEFWTPSLRSFGKTFAISLNIWKGFNRVWDKCLLSKLFSCSFYRSLQIYFKFLFWLFFFFFFLLRFTVVVDSLFFTITSTPEFDEIQCVCVCGRTCSFDTLFESFKCWRAFFVLCVC